jgi:type IV secretion system protein VirB8
MSAPDLDTNLDADEELGPLARRKRASRQGRDDGDLADRNAAGPLTRATYYAQATSWAGDSLASLQASQKLAWRVAIGAGALSLILGLALLLMMPLKQTLPFLVTVDRETGYVQATQTANIANTTAADAATKSAVTLYVLARETFDAADYRSSYERTLRWSSGRAETEYRSDWDRANPNSVHSRYRPTTRVKVTVKNVSILSPTSAVVRFDTEQTEGPQTGGSRRPWVATLTYNFAPRPLPGADQYLNPLGFQVSDYRRDSESTDSYSTPAPYVPPPAPVAPAPTPGGIDPATGLPSATPDATTSPDTSGLIKPVPSDTPVNETPPTGIGGMDTADPTQDPSP